MTDVPARRSPVNLQLLEGEVSKAMTEFRNTGGREATSVVQAAGRLSAESIKNEYDLAAKSLEGMGTDVNDLAQKLETRLAELDHDMKLLQDAAGAIRDKGKAIYLEIEQASQKSKDLRDTVATARQKIGA